MEDFRRTRARSENAVLQDDPIEEIEDLSLETHYGEIAEAAKCTRADSRERASLRLQILFFFPH